jgi:LysR family glycine cleavage system transcriptional activator
MDSPLARLPSLDLLRGFVAVARRMSVTQAAADLFLTQSAVSRQIRALEDHLGLPLFHRRHRALALTDDGERLFRLADAWLTQLSDQLDSLRQRTAAPPVTLTSTIGAVSLWLLPRLGEFQALHPAIDVRVSAGNRVVDLEHEAVDLALRYGPAERQPAGAVRLFDEQIVPVASPALGLAVEFERNDFSRLTLLEYDEMGRPWMLWSDWLAAIGLPKAQPRARLAFNQYDQVIYAALAGHGVALGRAPLVADMLADGRLVALHHRGSTMVPDFAYWLIERRGGSTPSRRLFADWLLAEAARTRSLIARNGAAERAAPPPKATSAPKVRGRPAAR